MAWPAVRHRAACHSRPQPGYRGGDGEPAPLPEGQPLPVQLRGAGRHGGLRAGQLPPPLRLSTCRRDRVTAQRGRAALPPGEVPAPGPLAGPRCRLRGLGGARDLARVRVRAVALPLGGADHLSGLGRPVAGPQPDPRPLPRPGRHARPLPAPHTGHQTGL